MVQFRRHVTFAQPIAIQDEVVAPIQVHVARLREGSTNGSKWIRYRGEGPASVIGPGPHTAGVSISAEAGQVSFQVIIEIGSQPVVRAFIAGAWELLLQGEAAGAV